MRGRRTHAIAARRAALPWWLVLAGSCLLGAAPASPAHARTPGDDTDTARAAREINQRVSDPVSLTWSLKIKNTLSFLLLSGHGNHAEYQLQFQPVLPVALGRHLKLIARPQLTLLTDTPYLNDTDQVRRTVGFGDTVLDLVLGPRIDPWLVALGPTFVFPSASADQTGQGKWQLGPAGVLGYRVDPFLAAVIVQQWYSVAGADDRSVVSAMHLQYIVNYVFGDGWSIGTSPTVMVNWTQDAGSRTTFPIGITAGKVFRVAATPLKLALETDYMPVRAPNAPQVLLQLTVTPVIRSPQSGDW